MHGAFCFWGLLHNEECGHIEWTRVCFKGGDFIDEYSENQMIVK